MIKYSSIDLIQFPTTRYQGSKRKILPWIFENLKHISFDTVLDGFGGTGSVSFLFKKMGKSVHYNDKLKFNYLIGRALIENSNVRLEDEDINDLFLPKESGDKLKVVENYFRDIYFLDEENKLIDTIVSNIMEMNVPHLPSLEYKKAMAYYALFQTSLIKRPYNLFHRKNLNLRMADVKRNFGNKTTWDKSIQFFIEKFAKEANSFVFDNTRKCTALNKSIFNIDPYGYDLIYLDPPYISKSGSNESSDYLRCYHFLEGLANYSEWESKIDHTTPNLRFNNSGSENDFNQKNIEENLQNIIAKFQKSTIVLSYKIGGIPSIDVLEKMVGMVKSRVYTVSLHYKYALNKQNGNADLNREVLIIGI